MTFGEKSGFEGIARKRAFLLLMLDDLKKNIRGVQCDITKCYKEKSQIEESARKILFLRLILNNLMKDRLDMKNYIIQCDKEIIADKRKQEPSIVNRFMLITGIAKTLSTHELYCLANKLKDNKKKIEENLNELKQGAEGEISGVLAMIEEYAEQINIYDEERKNRKPGEE
jgi:hypothetical protein